MITEKTKRQKEILKLFIDVESSDLSVENYFTTYQTPVSRAQYYLLKKQYDQIGLEALDDRRQAGNARKVKPEHEELVNGILTYNRHLTSKSLKDELQSKWGIEFSQSRIDQLRQKYNLRRIKPTIVEKEIVQFAGIEIFSALAHHIGILEEWLETITQRLNRISQADASKKQQSKGDHIYARRRGKFSARYNRLPSIRKHKFAAITEKVKNKDLSRLSLYQAKDESVSRRNLAVLLLPLVTNNGASRSLDTPLGNALKSACGYNYKNATIDKYLRELKYLQISSELINCNARFWSAFWKQYDSSHQNMACYYIDGNVKPLWSSKRCRKGKVTMLGRVMGCLEQVVSHDGYGHPLYFQTFSGHADLQQCALQSIEQLSELMNEGQPTHSKRCHRALIMDGGGNAVGTLRAFSKSDQHYITILDSNQMNARKFKHLCPKERYRYGEAELTDCLIEMRDSKEPTYIYESRAGVQSD